MIVLARRAQERGALSVPSKALRSYSLPCMTGLQMSPPGGLLSCSFSLEKPPRFYQVLRSRGKDEIHLLNWKSRTPSTIGRLLLTTGLVVFVPGRSSPGQSQHRASPFRTPWGPLTEVHRLPIGEGPFF